MSRKEEFETTNPSEISFSPELVEGSRIREASAGVEKEVRKMISYLLLGSFLLLSLGGVGVGLSEREGTLMASFIAMVMGILLVTALTGAAIALQFSGC